MKKKNEDVGASKPKTPKAAAVAGTREHPWVLQTPPGTSEFTAFRDDSAVPPAIIVQVWKTELRYDVRCLSDLHAMLKGAWRLDVVGKLQTSRNLRRRERSRPGAVRQAMRLAVGTD